MAGEGRPGPAPFPHGTPARYNSGCRCDDCRRANTEYRRLRSRAKVVQIDDLPVTCWCEETIVFVPREVVLECRTESCGRAGCEEAA